ncbi:hypothetical protein CASFOL_035069 [Castilleja foliolosa]|uniref:Phototropic-responsive NPH3 family protein n=1 Tax=Castilleja foliolosa TaxID=1961234 RepID=A0ABD3BSC0_9LAMI
MAPAGKTSGFHREGNNWFCNSSLPSDITVVVDEVNFNLHKFPLISRSGKITTDLENSQTITEKTPILTLDEFPGGPDTFLTIVKFCYNNPIEFTPKNIVILYCASDYLAMSGEDNLLSKSENYFQKHILQQWKDCILALQTCEQVIPRADKLQIVNRCTNALSVMICTDPTLFGWPMRMYGSLQSPGGSILWNGINTGAKINISESEPDWWFEDASYLSVGTFERLILTMESKGIKPEIFTRAIIYYCKKHLPGLGRWQSEQQQSAVLSRISMKPANVNQIDLLRVVVKLLPEKKDKSFCRFLLGLLRVGLILRFDDACRDCLEKRIGVQLEFATLDSLLIPSYSDSDTLYNSDCVERMVCYFVSSSSGTGLTFTSSLSSSVDLETSSSPESGRSRRVAKLVDDYLAEIASDVNLKPGKVRSLAEALPESSRTLHDGMYRALDIYFKAHPSLSDKERENLCSIIDFQKLSLEACAHASQNERLPLRIILQVLFFEQMQLRTSLAGCLNVMDNTESAPAVSQPNLRVQPDGWVKVVRENQVLKVDMERMRGRVGELEQEFGKIKEEMKRVSKSHSCLNSPRLVGCLSSDAQKLDVLRSRASTPRASVEQSRLSIRLPWHRKSSSLSG